MVRVGDKVHLICGHGLQQVVPANSGLDPGVIVDTIEQDFFERTKAPSIWVSRRVLSSSPKIKSDPSATLKHAVPRTHYPKRKAVLVTCQYLFIIYFSNTVRYKPPPPTSGVTLRHTPLSLSLTHSLHHDTSFCSSSDEEAKSKPPRLNVSRPLHRLGSHPLVPRCGQRR